MIFGSWEKIIMISIQCKRNPLQWNKWNILITVDFGMEKVNVENWRGNYCSNNNCCQVDVHKNCSDNSFRPIINDWFFSICYLMLLAFIFRVFSFENMQIYSGPQHSIICKIHNRVHSFVFLPKSCWGGGVGTPGVDGGRGWLIL